MFEDQSAMQTSKLNCALYTPQQYDAQYASKKYHPLCGVGMQVRLVYKKKQKSAATLR